VIDLVGWAAIFAAMMVWEGVSLSMRGSQWLTISDMARALTRPVLGRWAFFALWLWFGWHYFIRGWTFFLRGSPPGGGGGPGASKTASEVLAQVVFPLVIAYGFVVGTLALAWRHRRRARPAAPVHVGVTQVVRHTAVTVIGGYVAFVAAMGVYSLAAGHAAAGIAESALRDGAVLTFGLVVPAFVVLTSLERVLRRHVGR